MDFFFGCICYISIHALREEGDLAKFDEKTGLFKFLSTPSARRATIQLTNGKRAAIPISIHALREEGDGARASEIQFFLEFLSTPSARRATINVQITVIHNRISIHALREEGDHWYGRQAGAL